MERGSDTHGPQLDDELKKESEALERSGTDPRAEEWRQAEPPGDAEPDATRTQDAVYRGGTPPGLDPTEVEGRTEMARHLEPSIFPTDRSGVLQCAAGNNAPDTVIGQLASLPVDERFETMQDVWSALGGGKERRPSPEGHRAARRDTTEEP